MSDKTDILLDPSKLEDLKIYVQFEGKTYSMQLFPMSEDKVKEIGVDHLEKSKKRMEKVTYRLLLEKMGFGVMDVSLEEVSDDPNQIKNAKVAVPKSQEEIYELIKKWTFDDEEE